MCVRERERERLCEIEGENNERTMRECVRVRKRERLFVCEREGESNERMCEREKYIFLCVCIRER